VACLVPEVVAAVPQGACLVACQVACQVAEAASLEASLQGAFLEVVGSRWGSLAVAASRMAVHRPGEHRHRAHLQSGQ